MSEQDEWREATLKVVESLGIRWVRLAKQAGIDRAKLSRWKNGHGELSNEESSRLTDAISVAWAKQAGLDELPTATVGQDAEEYGKAVRSARRRYEITQIELAAKAEIARATLSLVETGYVELDREQSLRLDNALTSLIAEKKASRRALFPGGGIPLIDLLRASQPVSPAVQLEAAHEAGRELWQENSELKKQVAEQHGQIEELKEELRKLAEAEEATPTKKEASNG